MYVTTPYHKINAKKKKKPICYKDNIYFTDVVTLHAFTLGQFCSSTFVARQNNTKIAQKTTVLKTS